MLITEHVLKAIGLQVEGLTLALHRMDPRELASIYDTYRADPRDVRKSLELFRDMLRGALLELATGKHTHVLFTVTTLRSHGDLEVEAP